LIGCRVDRVQGCVAGSQTRSTGDDNLWERPHRTEEGPVQLCSRAVEWSGCIEHSKETPGPGVLRPEERIQERATRRRRGDYYSYREHHGQDLRGHS